MIEKIEKPVRLKVSVQFDGSPGLKSKKIYANGNMQVRVQVLLSGIDKNGKPAPLTPSIYNTVRLIDYKTGERLSGGWHVSVLPNRYSQALYGVPGGWHEETAPDPATRIVNVWVSSKVAMDLQIAAEVNLNGVLIRTNNKTQGHAADSSVNVEAQPPVVYDLSRFRLDPVASNPFPATTLTHFYLGLYVDGQQIKLVSWSSKLDAKNAIVSLSHPIFESRGPHQGGEKYWWRSVCHFAGVEEKELYLALPAGEHMERQQSHYIPVNDQSGMLSIVQGVSPDLTIDESVWQTDAFYFTAFDIYGTGHNLCLRFDNTVVPNSFVLTKA